MVKVSVAYTCIKVHPCIKFYPCTKVHSYVLIPVFHAIIEVLLKARWINI